MNIRARAPLRSVLVLAASAMALTGALTAAPSGATTAAHADTGSVSRLTVVPLATSTTYVTLLFARTQITAADACAWNNKNIARLDTTVASYLRSQGLTGTGSIVTGVTRATSRTCVHWDESLTASWADATRLAQAYGWRFVSHTATYPSNLAGLSPTQAKAETCDTATTLVQHGLPGAHGMIAYPGAQTAPDTLQTTYGQTCFDWGRRYAGNGLTTEAMAPVAPYWQNTTAVNGGPCRRSGQPCYTVAAVGGARYTSVSSVITTVNALQPGQWYTLQAYLLVTGRSPAYTTNTTRWDCTAADPLMHWTNDNERYCYNDWQRIVSAVRARVASGAVVVTDPESVGIAWGRPDFR